MGDRPCRSSREYELGEAELNAPLRTRARTSHGSSSTAGTTAETGSNVDSIAASSPPDKKHSRYFIKNDKIYARRGKDPKDSSNTVNVSKPGRRAEEKRPPKLRVKPEVVVSQQNAPSVQSPLQGRADSRPSSRLSQSITDPIYEYRSPTTSARNTSSKNSSRDSSAQSKESPGPSKDKGKGKKVASATSSPALSDLVSEDEESDEDDHREIPADMDPGLRRGLERELARKKAARELRNQERQEARERQARAFDDKDRRIQLLEAELEALKLRREEASRPSGSGSNNSHRRQPSETHVVKETTRRTTRTTLMGGEAGNQNRSRMEEVRLSSGDTATTELRRPKLNLRDGGRASRGGTAPSTPVRENAIVSGSDDESVAESQRTERQRRKTKKKSQQQPSTKH